MTSFRRSQSLPPLAQVRTLSPCLPRRPNASRLDRLPAELQDMVVFRVAQAGALGSFSRASSTTRTLACNFACRTLVRQCTKVERASSGHQAPPLSVAEARVYDACANLLVNATRYADRIPRGSLVVWHPALRVETLWAWEERALAADTSLSVSDVRASSVALMQRDERLVGTLPDVVGLRAWLADAQDTPARGARVARSVRSYAADVSQRVSQRGVPSIAAKHVFCFKECVQFLRSVASSSPAPRLEDGLVAWAEQEVKAEVDWQTSQDGQAHEPPANELDVKTIQLEKRQEVRDLSHQLIRTRDHVEESLDLADMNLFSLPPGFGELISLRTLDLGGTRLKGDLPALRPLRRLVNLSLGDTNVDSIDFARSLISLEQLNIEDTLVESLAPLKELKKLSALDLLTAAVADNEQNRQVLLNLPLQKLWLPTPQAFPDVAARLAPGVIQEEP